MRNSKHLQLEQDPHNPYVWHAQAWLCRWDDAKTYADGITIHNRRSYRNVSAASRRRIARLSRLIGLVTSKQGASYRIASYSLRKEMDNHA